VKPPDFLKKIGGLIPPFEKCSFLNYVTFNVDETKDSTFLTRNKLLFFTFFVFISVALVSASRPIIEQFLGLGNMFWVNSSNHTLIEVFCGLIAIIIGLILSWEYLVSGKKNILFLVYALFSMGILDFFHAFSDYCHNLFVWFHSSGAFWGAVLMFSSTFFINDKKGKKKKSRIWTRRFHILLGIGLVLLYALLSMKYYSIIPDVLRMKLPHHTHITLVKGHFSDVIYIFNFSACLFFLFSGFFFIKGFLKSNDVIYLIFGLTALLLFESEISFTISNLWDFMWWYWHFIKVIVFSGLLLGLAYGFARSFYNLDKSKMALSTLLKEIEHKNVEIMKAYDRLKETQRYLSESEKLASIGKIAASMAHEIRNPLGAITNSLEVLKKYGSASVEDAELFEILDKEIDRLNKLVEDFLSYSRPSRLNVQKTDINGLIGETLKVFKMNEKTRGLIIREIFTYPIPLLQIDNHKIKQVLLNIFFNALQAMPAGKGVLSVQTKYKKTENEAEINITDTGTGMSDDILARVFEPFFSTKDTGMGLGLNIAHKIIREHGGYISMFSKVNQGTQIQLNLPVNPDETALREETETVTSLEHN
jgi:signal transduction histidine kinase